MEFVANVTYSNTLDALFVSESLVASVVGSVENGAKPGHGSQRSECPIHAWRS